MAEIDKSIENPENETRLCFDCSGSGKVSVCGCPTNTRTCSYCSGTGQVLTFAARELRRNRTELRYTQTDMDALHASAGKLREVLDELLKSGVELDDVRMNYVVMQVDRGALDDARAVSAETGGAK